MMNTKNFAIWDIFHQASIHYSPIDGCYNLPTHMPNILVRLFYCCMTQAPHFWLRLILIPFVTTKSAQTKFWLINVKNFSLSNNIWSHSPSLHSQPSIDMGWHNFPLINPNVHVRQFLRWHSPCLHFWLRLNWIPYLLLPFETRSEMLVHHFLLCQVMIVL